MEDTPDQPNQITPPVTQASIQEYAAKVVERGAGLLNEDAIAAVIRPYANSVGGSKAAAIDIVAGLMPLFTALSTQIRQAPIEELAQTLTERDKSMVELTIQRIHDQCFATIRNPARKPRVNFEPVKRRGVWWDDLKTILDSVREGNFSLEQFQSDSWRQGFEAAKKKIKDRIMTVSPTVNDPVGGTRMRRAQDWADIVENTQP